MSGHKEALRTLHEAQAAALSKRPQDTFHIGSMQETKELLQQKLQAAQVIADLVSPHYVNPQDNGNPRILNRSLVESIVRDYSIEGVDKNFLSKIWDAYLRKAKAQTDIRLVSYFVDEQRGVTTAHIGMDNEFGQGPQTVLGEIGNTIALKLSFMDETYMFPSIMLTLKDEPNLSMELTRQFEQLLPFDQIMVVGHYALAIDNALSAAA